MWVWAGAGARSIVRVVREAEIETETQCRGCRRPRCRMESTGQPRPRAEAVRGTGSRRARSWSRAGWTTMRGRSVDVREPEMPMHETDMSMAARPVQGWILNAIATRAHPQHRPTAEHDA